MTDVSLQVHYREKRGKAYRRELFRQDMVPGVVYGKAVGAVPVQVGIKPLKNVLAKAKGGVVDLTVQGPAEDESNSYKVLVKDIQVDPIKQIFMNIDFHQISMEELVSTTVAISFVGEVELGIVQYGIRELQISCLPDNIPGSITVNIDGMEIGSTIAVQDLTLPEDVTPLDDPKTVVVTVLAEQKEEEEEVDEEAAEGVDEEVADEEKETPEE